MRNRMLAIALVIGVAFGSAVTLAQPADAQTQTDPTERAERREARLQQMVEDGIITQERADEIRDRLAERAARVEERRAQRAMHIEELAATLNLTADELREALRSGSTIAELAQSAGVDLDTIIDRIEAQKTARLADAVEAGKIDQATADEFLSGLRDRITARLNGERPDPGDRPQRPGHGPRGPRGFGGFGGPGDADAGD